MNPKPQNFFDGRAEAFANFAGESFSWRHIEMPAMDGHLAGVMGEDWTVLDIGSGSGRTARHLVELGAKAEHVTGIDSSHEMTVKAKLSTPGINFVQGNITAMPFWNNQFDLVTSNMVLHLVDGVEMANTLGEIARVLKLGGLFFSVDTNPYQDPDNLHIKEWVEKISPWGEGVPVFQHDYQEIVDDVAPSVGLEVVDINYPAVLPEGEAVNPAEYKRYTDKSFRICGLFEKVRSTTS